MAHSERINQLANLAKVIVGVGIIGAAIVAALVSPHLQIAGAMHLAVTAVVVGIFALIFPVSYAVYKKMDELQKKLHEHASVAALTLVVSVAGMIGVLQASDVIPLFNQFWFFAAGIAVWGIALVFSDRSYK